MKAFYKVRHVESGLFVGPAVGSVGLYALRARLKKGSKIYPAEFPMLSKNGGTTYSQRATAALKASYFKPFLEEFKLDPKLEIVVYSAVEIAVYPVA